MANRNTAGFGFRQSGTLGNTPATQGLSQYWIDSAASVNLFNGMAMKSSGGYMITGESATTVTTIGVLYGIYYNAASTNKPTWAHWYDATITPANSEDTTAFVLDNPMQLYSISTDGALTQAKHMQTFNMNAVSGSSISEQSTNTLDINNEHATNYSWRVIRIADDPSNSDIANNFLSVIAISNLNEFVRKT